MKRFLFLFLVKLYIYIYIYIYIYGKSISPVIGDRFISSDPKTTSFWINEWCFYNFVYFLIIYILPKHFSLIHLKLLTNPSLIQNNVVLESLKITLSSVTREILYPIYIWVYHLSCHLT